MIVNLDGLDYDINQNTKHKVYVNGQGYIYKSLDDNKKHIRFYDHINNKTYYVERVWPNVGDNCLLFIDWSRYDGPTDSWSPDTTQYLKIPSSAISNMPFRFTITYIDCENFCKVNDGTNNHGGWHARNCFYKINKII